MSKITKTGSTLTEVATTLTDDLIDGLTGSLKLFASSTATTQTFYSARTVGIASLGHLAVGVFVGDRWGASIPLIGQGRN